MRTEKLIKLIKKTNVTSRELKEINKSHMLYGLISEVGEIAGVHQRFMRGDYGKDKAMKRLKLELGDVMYYLFGYINALGLDEQEIYDLLEKKLLERQAKNTIKGENRDEN